MSTLSVNVNNNDKDVFSEICSELGMNISTAINIFIKTVNRTRSIPFSIAIDNKYEKLPLTTTNINKMLEIANDDEFSEKESSIMHLRELTKDDVW